MKTTAQLVVIAALAASGVFAFACGGGNAESGGSTTPSATPSSSAPTTQSAAVTPATASATPTTAAVAPAPPLVIAAMKLVAPKGTIELKDDGTVMADGKPVLKFVGAELQDKDGKSLIAVAADGTIKFEGAAKGAKFNDKDEVIIADGAKLSVADDGTVKMFNPDGKADKDSGKLKITGFKPTARRAGTVFVLAMMMSRSESTSSQPAASVAPPSASAAKPPTSKK